MSAQRLSARKTRRIEQVVGVPVLRAWAHGGTVFSFVTDRHQHGVFDSRTGEWQWETDPLHYSSCSDLFPISDRMEEGT